MVGAGPPAPNPRHDVAPRILEVPRWLTRLVTPPSPNAAAPAAVVLPEPACESVREKLSEYVDGELQPGVFSVVDAHLAACQPCRRFACELGALVRALHQLRCGCDGE